MPKFEAFEHSPDGSGPRGHARPASSCLKKTRGCGYFRSFSGSKVCPAREIAGSGALRDTCRTVRRLPRRTTRVC